MSDFANQARALHSVIRAALEIGATPEVLARLTDYAALLVTHDYTTEAANLLAVVLRHADVPFDVYDRADDLWIDLEGRLCPRVMADAKDAAAFVTLRGATDAAFALLDSDSAGSALPPSA